MQKYSPYRAICNMLVINTVGKFLCCVIFHSLILAESVLALSGFVINWVLCLRDFYLSLHCSASEKLRTLHTIIALLLLTRSSISTIFNLIRVQRALAPAFSVGVPFVLYQSMSRYEDISIGSVHAFLVLSDLFRVSGASKI